MATFFTDSEDQTENKDDIIPIQVPHQPQEGQLDNLIWMANNIQDPYQGRQMNVILQKTSSYSLIFANTKFNLH